MDSGVEVLRAQALLLKLFLMTGGRQSAEYIKVLSASIMLWGFYESSQHPCWELFRNNASAFNEESGEISLSVLARDVSRGGVRSDCAKVSQTYALVKAKAELAQDIGVDIAGDDFGSDSHGRRIKVDSGCCCAAQEAESEQGAVRGMRARRAGVQVRRGLGWNEFPEINEGSADRGLCQF